MRTIRRMSAFVVIAALALVMLFLIISFVVFR